jgi:hypothetical protein
MKPILALTALILSLSGLAHAEPATKRTQKKETIRTSLSSAESRRHLDPDDGGFGVTLGLGSLSSKFHFGTLFRWHTPLNWNGTPLVLGAKTGFIFGPDSPSDFAIPILGSMTYHLPDHGGGLRPFVGVDLGISINHTSSFTNIAGISGESDTRVKIAALINSGVNIGERFFFEIPAGSLGDVFTILPSVGIRF